MKRFLFTTMVLVLNFLVSGQAQTTTSSNPVKVDSFACNGILEYAGCSYRTVLIGTQCWMRDNLNIGKWTDQSQLQKQTDNGILEKYCYGNDFINCDQWGGLYQWDEMMQYVQTANAQGICPAGWHIPSSPDWKTLIRYLGGEALAGGKIKYTGSNGWATPNVGADNSSGFTALPGGYFDYMAQRWHNQYSNGYFWSSETITKGTAVAMMVSSDRGNLDLYEEFMPSALSVRCIRNE